MSERYQSVLQQNGEEENEDRIEQLRASDAAGDNDAVAVEVHHDLTSQSSPMSHQEYCDDDDHHDGAVDGAPGPRGPAGRIMGSLRMRDAFRRLQMHDDDEYEYGDEEEGDYGGREMDELRTSAPAAAPDDGKGRAEEDVVSRSSTPTTAGNTTADTSNKGAAAAAPKKLAKEEEEEEGFENEDGPSPPADAFRIGSSGHSYYSSEDDLNLEDDLVDDDEDSLGRYAFNFDSSSDHVRSPRPQHVHVKSIGQQTPGDVRTHSHPQRLDDSHRSSSVSASSLDRITSPIRGAVDRVRTVRAERRRKRAERLLALPDDPGTARWAWVCTRFSMCMSSWCDLTDRGVLLLATVVAAAVVVYRNLDEEEEADARRLLVAVGVPLLVLRLCWRGVYWAVWGRRAERRRQARMEVYDGLNGEHGTGGIEIPGMHMNDEDSEVGSLTLGREDKLDDRDHESVLSEV